MNINRDYLIINDVKKSNVKLDNGSIFFYITDKNTQNIFVNLVINVSKNDLIQKYANIENAKDYTLTMNIVKPSNTYKVVEGKLHDKENAIFEFNLNEDCCDEIGPYRCELLTKCNINGHEEITTSNKLTYKVKSSVLNDLDNIVEAPEYPLVIQLFDKLSDIEQYEEDRRANELARQVAEQQRQTRFDALDADMTDSIQAMDDKVVEVDNRITAKENAVDKLITDTKADIDNYKVAKDQEIDDYKTAKDTEINNAITTQDNKINEFINERNDRLNAIEAKNTEQDGRLDIAENRLANIGNDITNTMQPIIDEHTSRLDAIEAIDVAQNNRLEAIEVKNQQQDDRLLDIEKVNKRQDIDLKCLFTEAKNNMMDITEEGNSVYLQNSTEGHVFIDEIKGNTLVNYNKEPNKELILNGNINTSGDNAVTLTEGVGGGLVDVALEGNTLVNVSKTKDSTALPLEEELTYLYANTQYTVQFVSDKAITADITLGGTKLLAQSIVVGLNRISITTPATLVDNKLIISGTGASISNVVVTDTDREFGYFEGMKSVGECEELEVKSSNKNLFDEKYLLGGQVVTFNGKKCYKYLDNKDNFKFAIDFKPNTRYTLTLTCYREDSSLDKSINIRIRYTDEAYSAIDIYSGNTKIITSKEGKTVRSITGNWSWNTAAYIDLETTQLEEGDTATDYIPHQSNTQQLTHEPLRAVGDVKDRYVLIDGKWYIERNCGVRTYQEGDKDNYKTDLVNTVYPLEMPTYEEINYNPLEVYSGATHISVNSTIPTNITVKNHGFNCLLKPSTTYTISSNLGLNTVTTPSTLTEDCLRFMDTDTSDVTTMKDVLVLEGDWTNKANLIPGSFSGIKSVFEQELVTDENDDNFGKYKVTAKVVGKNLFHGELVLGNINYNTGELVPNNAVMRNKNYIEVKPSTLYTITSSHNKSDIQYMFEYDHKKNFIKFTTVYGKITTTSKTKFILTKSQTNNVNGYTLPDNLNTNIQIEEGDTATEYEPYKENNITFYINEPLRGVGDVKDRVYVKDDKVVVQRNCGIREYQDGDFGTYPTDKVNTVYQLAEPIYEEVEYNDTKLFIESFKNSTLSYNSNVPVTSKLYYSYSVPIVDTVAQTANVTDQQDSMIIDLATQVAVMEMMLM